VSVCSSDDECELGNLAGRCDELVNFLVRHSFDLHQLLSQTEKDAAKQEQHVDGISVMPLTRSCAFSLGLILSLQLNRLPLLLDLFCVHQHGRNGVDACGWRMSQSAHSLDGSGISKQ